jgi:DNA-binding GntR family transcriptional regulator
MSRNPGTGEPLQLTLLAAAQIRGLIIDRVLLPGEKIRQVELAERIGVSRSPLREALRILESEGVVSYETNRGYVVARLDDNDLAQSYRMRAMLEDELLRTVRRPDGGVLSDLKNLNEKMIVAIDERNVAEVLRYNREFHFTIFDLSPLNQFRREIHRLWQMSEGYSAAWWWRQPEARTRINTEHKAIISSLRRFDLDRLVEVCAEHRVGGLERSVTGVAGIVVVR